MLSTYHNIKRNVMAAAVAVVTILIMSFMLLSCSKPEAPEKSSMKDRVKSSGPLIENNYTKVTPLDELGVDTNNPKALSVVGDQYFENGNYVEAVDIYKKVIALDPDDVDTYNDLGLSYQYLNQSDKAIETLQKGSEINPSYQRIWISLGFVLASSGNNSEARTALNKAIELGPDTPIGKEAQRMLNQVQ